MGRYRVGVDLGGTNIKVGLFSEDFALLGKKSSSTDPFNRHWKAVVADMAALINALLHEHGIAVGDCEKIGVGCPGLIDSNKGEVVFSGNFNWEYIPLLEELNCFFDLPMAIANDGDCAVFGETIAGAAKGFGNVIMFTLGTGVGGGAVINGRPQGGGLGKMEYGHTIIVAGGEPCACGARGCLEAYASATALIREAKRAAKKNPNSRLWDFLGGDLEIMNGKIPFQAAKLGDITAKLVVEEYIRYVGIGVVNAINIWRPDMILLGGGIANEGVALTVPVTEYARKNAFAGERGYIARIANARLGNDAGLYGAAAL